MDISRGQLRKVLNQLFDTFFSWGITFIRFFFRSLHMKNKEWQYHALGIAITSDKKGNSAFWSAYLSTSKKLERKTKRSLQIKTWRNMQTKKANP